MNGVGLRSVLSRVKRRWRRGSTSEFGISKSEIRSLVGREDPVIFEIGCADGIDTIEMLREFRSPAACFYCFEPDPRNLESFKTRVSDPRVTLCEAAVSDRTGTRQFFQSSTIYSSSVKEPNLAEIQDVWAEIEFLPAIVVESVTLDDFVAHEALSRIDFLWADVQGAEDLVIKGGQKTFAQKVKWFYTEYSNREYYSASPDLATIMELLGPRWELVRDFGADALLLNTEC